MPVATPTRKTRDPEADLKRWPPAHLKQCPVALGEEDPAVMVEYFPEFIRTGRGAPQDVTNDQRPGRNVMVAHCCTCGEYAYHDL